MISHKHKCIFIHVPKCAGTSIEAALGHYDGFGEIRGGQDHRSITDIKTGVKLKDVLRRRGNLILFLKCLKKRLIKSSFRNNNLLVNQKEFRTYFKFVFVRNPWDRVFSAYKNIINDEIHIKKNGYDKNLSFNDFVKDHMKHNNLTRPHCDYIKDFNGKIAVDFIGKFENLNEDFKHVCNQLNLLDAILPHKIRSKASYSSYKDVYNKETKRIVAIHFKEDIELFKYEF